MKAYLAEPEQTAHAPQMFLSAGTPRPSPEAPERVARLRTGAEAAGCTIARPPDFGPGPLAAIHTPEYLEFLATIHDRWRAVPGAAAEVIANIHPTVRTGRYPSSPVGQAGYHMADTACPIGAATFEAARWSANAALGATWAVLDGARAAYALCRPPGHHAFADMAGGFCFLNTAAIAAQHLRTAMPRVAILDIDLHHGNGTQGIFYHRGDVLTVSIHVDPVDFYPFFWGHAEERGAGAGLGANLNLPLPRGSGDGPFLDALNAAARRIAAFAPGALVLAAGLDAYHGDPFGGLTVTTGGVARIGAAVAGMGLPVVIVQEGGYLCDALGDNLTALLSEFA